MIPSFGGVYVRVPYSQLIPAGEFMLDAVTSAESRLEEATGTRFEPPEKTRHLMVWSMLFLWTGVAYIILIPIGIALFWLIEAIAPESWNQSRSTYHEPDAPYFENEQIIDIGTLVLTTKETEVHGGGIALNITPEGIVFFGLFIGFLIFEFAYLSNLPKTSRETETT